MAVMSVNDYLSLTQKYPIIHNRGLACYEEGLALAYDSCLNALIFCIWLLHCLYFIQCLFTFFLLTPMLLPVQFLMLLRLM